MAKPQKITITELAAQSSSSRNALFQKCCRANKKKESLIFVNGSGWFSITKPGKEYILYLVQSDAVPVSVVKHEVEENVKQLFDAVGNLVCSECSTSVLELKQKILQ
jgi:hypothetical protein